MTKSTQLAHAEPTTNNVLSPAEMIGQAIASNSGPEVMEKLLALQERWDARNAKMAFDDAMAELRQNMPAIIKRQEVDFTTNKGRTNYRYEDLSAVTEALSPVMASHGLSFRWRTESGKDSVTVTCIIAHRDGHSEENSLTAGFDNSGNKNAIQAIGSAVTYLQRYTLKAAVGVAASYDDDGQSAATPAHDSGKAKPKAQARGDYAQYEALLRSATTRQSLQNIWENGINWSEVPQDWKALLVEEKDKCLADMAQNAVDVQKGKSPSESLDDQFPGDVHPEMVEAARNVSAG